MKITKRQLRRIIREQSNQPVDPRKMRDMGYNDAMDGKYMDPNYENQIDYKMGFNEALGELDNDSSAGSMYEGNKVTKRQLRRIIKEEKARILAEQQLDPQVASAAMAELKNDGWMSMIQAAANDAAGELDKLGDQVDQKLMDAGLNEIAMDMRKVVELLDKIRDAAADAEVFKK